MPAIPEGATTVTGEGRDLATAIAAAASELGVETTHVGHKLDLAHFRNQAGGMLPKQTVKIVAWQRDPEEGAETIKAPPRGARSDDDKGRGRDRDDRGRGRDRNDRGRGRDRDDRGGRGGRDRDDRGGRGGDRDDKPRRERKADIELEETAASAFAKGWMEALLGHMDLEGTVEAGQGGEEVHLKVIVNRAGRLIGKRGSTLRSVRSLLKLALARAEFGDLFLEFDVDDPDGGKKRREDRNDRNDRDDRGGRGKGGGRGRDRDRDRKGGGGKYPEEKLVALATRAAEKAIESGKAITINLDLNSYDRRIVHVTIAELDGVDTVSDEKDDGTKVVKVVPELASDDAEESDE